MPFDIPERSSHVRHLQRKDGGRQDDGACRRDVIGVARHQYRDGSVARLGAGVQRAGFKRAVGGAGLSGVGHGHHHLGRQARRPHRPPPGADGRPDVFRPGVAALRRGANAGRADRRPRDSGSGRRNSLGLAALDCARGRPQRTDGVGDGPVRNGVGHRNCTGSFTGRRTDRRPGLAGSVRPAGGLGRLHLGTRRPDYSTSGLAARCLGQIAGLDRCGRAGHDAGALCACDPGRQDRYGDRFASIAGVGLCGAWHLHLR
ncbi:hypothetical protein D3C71_1361330 [compost metagenome]